VEMKAFERSDPGLIDMLSQHSPGTIPKSPPSEKKISPRVGVPAEIRTQNLLNTLELARSCVVRYSRQFEQI
jgi:hypothetical protein